MTTITSPQNKPAYNRARLLVIFLGAAIFQAIFWQEKMALNTVFYSVFILASLFIIYKGQISSKVWTMVLAYGITLAAVVIHNTLLSKLAFTASMLLLVVLATNTYRSIHYAAVSLGNRIIQAIPQTFLDTVHFFKSGKNKQHKKVNYRLLFFPLILCIVFGCIYLLASDVLADMTANFFTTITDWLSTVFIRIDASRILFFLLAIFITGLLLIKHNNSKAEQKELLEKDFLERKKETKKRNSQSTWGNFMEFVTGKSPLGTMSLKFEYKAGIISLILLNILLAVLNTTDIVYVWFNHTYKAGFEWAGYVHYGANILIFSIFLATMVLLFFFRGNLNFLKSNRVIRVLASVWIVQNLVLAVSVFIRNYYYIEHMGLAYKRIGLLVFLLMVVVGLVTVYVKINYLKTFYYLLKINGWISFGILIIASTIDWDVTIAKYNLAHKDSIQSDIGFLLSLSDNTLPILDQNKQFIVEKKPSSQREFSTGNLEWRKQQYLKEHINYTWLSWNYADSNVLEYLRKAN